MDANKQKEGDAPTAPVETSTPKTSAQAPPPTASSPAPSIASSSSRPPYMPQFSTTTQMILKRINSKPGSLSSALSSASSTIRPTNFKKDEYEDTKRRLLMNLNIPLTMPLPYTGKSHSTNLSTTNKIPSSTASTLRAPVNDAFNLRTPLPTKSRSLPASKQAPQAQKMPAPKHKSKTQRGTKRKRGRDSEEGDTSSVLSELSMTDNDGTTMAMPAPAISTSAKEIQAAPTMTKSGRQVQKPTQYNPSEQFARDAKRRASGKQRTPEQQALCKVCTRGIGLSTNQIVYCDGCNCVWHQMCHEPYIDDDFVSDGSRPWFCSRCVAKRENHLARKKNIEGFKGVSWAAKTSKQKRSYLSSVSHSQLVNIIIYATELHPDLPIFPTHEPRRSAAQSARPSSTYDGTRIKVDTNTNSNSTSHTNTNINVNVPTGPALYSSKVSTPDLHLAVAKTRESSPDSDSVPPAWPKVGKGCLAGVHMDEDDLRDDDDYEAFSTATYNAKGRKVSENGKTV
ncbi:uncharacterized protein F4822DRAFT_421815 [Hypoxylon trugodes]|uniref:uncharacterized protein n=1 Tax=Hypoxylon trugodes TaxID=326681 RepID=UPI0021944311|nr:uncharacterized protein F4822DRAFT_421815 [Hypoxylon trugodes]KAI1383006.1 hypothetical protein F4822DRAFT_421815 [Hypoxylon trugodes]